MKEEKERKENCRLAKPQSQHCLLVCFHLSHSESDQSQPAEENGTEDCFHSPSFIIFDCSLFHLSLCTYFVSYVTDIGISFSHSSLL